MNKYVNGHSIKCENSDIIIDNRWVAHYPSPAEAKKEFVRLIDQDEITKVIQIAQTQELKRRVGL